VKRQARNVHIFSARVQQLSKLIELLRTIGQTVKEHGAALDLGAMIVESRIRARIDRRIGGVARDQLTDSGLRVRERY
jgi:hypothetical protein